VTAAHEMSAAVPYSILDGTAEVDRPAHDMPLVKQKMFSRDVNVNVNVTICVLSCPRRYLCNIENMMRRDRCSMVQMV
jgi:hypothetical protein